MEKDESGLTSEFSILELSQEFFRDNVCSSGVELNPINCVSDSEVQAPVVILHNVAGTAPIKVDVDD